ncbi:hypothetical protein [Phenylobacterium sp.]|uniref:hypothetical protein n=1 Tax=Phenylobacterium sp. TaxID=1871053 RepID=UPI003567E9FA
MRLARWVFTAAGIYGIAVLAPLLFVEAQVAAPARRLDHPEYFYGFLLVALACQVLFLVIARDPVRLRPAMIPCVLEKLPFGATAIFLWLHGRAATPVAGFAGIDIAWGLLFAVAYARTPKA